jgi:RNA-directed DNA polymerase
MVEERRPAEGNAGSETRPGLRAGVSVSSDLDRVRRVARRDKDVRFTALLHHVTVDRLEAAYRAIRPGAAPGVDGITWKDYGLDLEANLRDLHARVHRGAYRARPSRRAVAEVLNAVYEIDFLGFSYGFRPGRSPHHALDALAVGISTKRVNWVLDADIRDYFSRLDHSWLVKFLEHRIADRRVLRLIQKWLKAGVIEDGSWTSCEAGTPQGASISTLLANVYLHYVFDLWVHRWRRRQARGDVIVTRFADDFVVGFEHRGDAERFRAELRKRFASFGLALHEEKTRLIEFGRYAAERRRARGLPKPETFDFLGFTHICARTRETGWFALRRVTSKKRLRAKLREVRTELLRRRDQPIPEQGQWLGSVVRGHCNYYAVPGNGDAVSAFRDQAARHWRMALRRRSQRTSLTWERTARLKARWLPPIRIQHPWPSVRFDARTRGKSPVR